MKAQLIYPMAFYVFYVWSLALLNFRTRFLAIKSGQLRTFAAGWVTVVLIWIQLCLFGLQT